MIFNIKIVFDEEGKTTILIFPGTRRFGNGYVIIDGDKRHLAG